MLVSDYAYRMPGPGYPGAALLLSHMNHYGCANHPALVLKPSNSPNPGRQVIL